MPPSSIVATRSHHTLNTLLPQQLELVKSTFIQHQLYLPGGSQSQFIMSWNDIDTGPSTSWETSNPAMDDRSDRPPISSWAQVSGKNERGRVMHCQRVFSQYFEEFPADLSWTAEDDGFFVEAPTSKDTQDTSLVRCTRGRQIGGGGFGRVFKVLRENDGAVLAGKTCADLSKLAEEADMLKKHAHPHILRYEGMYEDPEFPTDNMLLTELCAGGSLQEMIDYNQHGLNPKAILRVIIQISRALEHIHSKRYFHSDVKPQNIFIRSCKPMNVVLGDCADIHPIDYKGRLLGTMQFHSPEICRTKRHQGIADDVWALGVSLLSMCGQAPRIEYEAKGRVRKPLMEKYPGQVIKHIDALRKLNTDHGIVQLAAKMLTRTVKDRATAEEICRMATGLLGRYEAMGEAGDHLNVTSPRGFEPPSFW